MYSVEDMARIAVSRIRPFSFYTYEDMLSEATLRILAIQDTIPDDCPTKQAYLIKAATNHVLNIRRKLKNDKTCELDENIAEEIAYSYEMRQPEEENEEVASVKIEDLLEYCKPMELILFKALEQKMSRQKFCKIYGIGERTYYNLRTDLRQHLLTYFEERNEI